MGAWVTRCADWLPLAGAVALGVGLVWGCASGSHDSKTAFPPGGQTLREAMELVCFVDERAGIGADGDPLEAGQRRDDFLDDHVRNPDIIYERTLWRTRAATERAERMREQAARAGLSSCPHADAVASDVFADDIAVGDESFDAP